MKPIGWREVPTNDNALGEAALSTKPKIQQLLIDTGDIPPEKKKTCICSLQEGLSRNPSTSSG